MKVLNGAGEVRATTVKAKLKRSVRRITFRLCTETPARAPQRRKQPSEPGDGGGARQAREGGNVGN